MKKKILEWAMAIGVILGVFLIIYFVVGLFDNITPEVGTVTISNGNTQIVPYGNQMYTTQDGDRSDGRRAILEEIESGLPEITSGSSLTAMYDNGSNNGDFYFSIYNSHDLSLYSPRGESFTVPDRSGAYIVRTETYWGNEVNNIGMEYYYKLIVE